MSKPTVQAFTPDTKGLIWLRQQGRCALDGLHTDTGHFHHRKPRRMGGGRDPRLGEPANGLFLHTACHDRIESNRVEALRNGWLLYAVQHPEDVPVLMWNGWFLLTGHTATPTKGTTDDGLGDSDAARN